MRTERNWIPMRKARPYLDVLDADLRVPLPPNVAETPEGRRREARAIAAAPAFRALLAETDREILEGHVLPAEQVRESLGVDEPSYDRETDTLYVPLSNALYDREERLDLWRRVAYAADGTPVAVEVERASQGVDVEGLPAAVRVAWIAGRLGLPLRETAPAAALAPTTRSA